MLHILPTQGDDKTGELGVVATDVLWLDLLNPTSAEVTNVEETVGATLPSLGALSEIETSSRLRNYGGVLYMSTPSAARRPEGTTRGAVFGGDLKKNLGSGGVREANGAGGGPWPLDRRGQGADGRHPATHRRRSGGDMDPAASPLRGVWRP